MKSSNKSFLTWLVLLLLVGMACNMPTTRFLSGPQPPARITQSPEEALASFNEKWRALNFATPDGPFSVTFTEAELTAAIAQALAQAEADGTASIPFKDVQVVLDDGLIYFYGRMQMDFAQANGLITVAPRIGDDGWIQVDVVSVEFGPLQIDPSLLSDLTESAEQSINAPIWASPFDITLSDIAVADGLMTINGTINP